MWPCALEVPGTVPPLVVIIKLFFSRPSGYSHEVLKSNNIVDYWSFSIWFIVLLLVLKMSTCIKIIIIISTHYWNSSSRTYHNLDVADVLYKYLHIVCFFVLSATYDNYKMTKINVAYLVPTKGHVDTFIYCKILTYNIYYSISKQNKYADNSKVFIQTWTNKRLNMKLIKIFE